MQVIFKHLQSDQQIFKLHLSLMKNRILFKSANEYILALCSYIFLPQCVNGFFLTILVSAFLGGCDSQSLCLKKSVVVSTVQIAYLKCCFD